MVTINLSKTVEGAETQMASSSSQQATTSSPAHSPPSLLSILRAPTQSGLMRKRKVRMNELPHTGTQKKKPSCSTNPKGVIAAQRAREFSDEMVTVSARKLFCSARREELSLINVIDVIM